MGKNVKTSYDIPKEWKKKRTDKEIMEDYSAMGLKGLVEKKEEEQKKKRHQYYSKVARLSKRVERLENNMKLFEGLLMQHLDGETDKRTSFQKWYRRRGKNKS